MNPGDRVRHHREDGQVEDGRLLIVETKEVWAFGRPHRLAAAIVQFRGRRRARCRIADLEVLK